jgi:release factor glutamine methyltransferase
MSTGKDSAAWTIARLLDWTREHFQQHGIDSPRLCAELLLAHAMRCERISLYTRFDHEPKEEVLEPFRRLVREATTGKPIAYLTGTKEFFSLPFQVTPDVLIPRPETEILVERTLDLARKAAITTPAILDLGTGSGCIVVSLARHLPEARLAASDVSEAAIAIARGNAERHGVGERIEFRAGDLFEPWGPSSRFDMIVCNPPYVATRGAPVDANVRDFEPHVALLAGEDGLDVIRRVLLSAPEHMRPGGNLLMEIAFDQAARVRDLLDGSVWQNINTYRDGAGHERVLHAQTVAQTSRLCTPEPG